MSYQLAINRVMGVCAFERTETVSTADQRSTKHVATQFLQQMRGMAEREAGKTSKLEDVFGKLEHALKSHEVRIKRLEPSSDELEFSIVRGTARAIDAKVVFEGDDTSPDTEPARDPIVGMFQSARYRLTMGEMCWNVRIRPSVTACVLEHPNRLSKIWLTFDGVADDPTHLPTEADSLKFIEMTSAASDAALELLRLAYIDALDGVHGKPSSACKHENARLRISLVDNSDLAFITLVDAMLLGSAKFANAAKGEYGPVVQEGAAQVLRFSEKVSGRSLNPQNFEFKLASNDPDLAAVYTMPPILEKGAETSRDRFVITGLASAMAMISSRLPTDDDWKRKTQKPELIRAISAARPLSAHLADQAARGLDAYTRRRQEFAHD